MANEKYFLSKRELQVLQMISDGLTDELIAVKLFVTVHTANAHRKKLREKMRVNNVAAMIAEGFRKKLVK